MKEGKEMKKSMKKLVVMGLCAAVTAAALTGCSSGSGSSAKAPESQSAQGEDAGQKEGNAVSNTATFLSFRLGKDFSASAIPIR